MIEAQETERDGRRPERTVYALLDAGRIELIDWLSEMLSTPAKEFTQFEAGLSLLPCLPPEDVLGLLDDRAQALQLVLVAERSVRDHASEQGVPGLFAVELEYRIAMREAERIAFTQSLAGQIRAGSWTVSRSGPGYHRPLGQPARAGRGNGELTMENAIEASDLTKTYGKGGQRASTGSPSQCLGRHGLRAARAERRRQVDHRIKILTTTRADPTTAKPCVAGIDVLADPARVQRAIGVVGQKASFDPVATRAREPRAAGPDLRCHGPSPPERRVDSFSSISAWSTEAANRAPPRPIPGGMARKLDCIALGLLHEPAVLFLDEPTTGLDPEARSRCGVRSAG
jgi:energy-coupling factor transporter ATP-binding protein EcfA2